MTIRIPARLLAGLLAAGLSAGLLGCATLFQGDEPAPRHAPRATPRPVERPAPARATADPGVVALRASLAEGARSILGAKQLLVRGRRFTMDCTGVVLACYWYAGIDLARDFGKFKGNGVTRIYKTLERDDLLYSTAAPLVGDIIFWDNTYSEEGKEGEDNPLSHVGMVLQVDSDGTITYIHHHVSRGIITEYMNLRSPGVRTMIDNGQVKVINSPLRLAVAGKPHAPEWLSGQLYRALGMGYLLP
jgi:hypothetical protein